MKIITNNQPRLLLDFNQLTPGEQAEFTLDGSELGRNDYVRYKGRVYSIGGEFMKSDTPGWDGALADSFFSGVLVRFVPGDNDRVIMGSWYA